MGDSGEGYPNGTITAIWSDGSFGEEDLFREEKLLVDVVGGFAYLSPYEAVSDNCPGLASQRMDEFVRIGLIDDPMDDVRIGSWLITWTNEEGEQSETVEVNFGNELFTEYYIHNLDEYRPGLHITITGVAVEPCENNEHEMSDWFADTDEYGHVLGTHSRVCMVCGFCETEEHGQSEWMADRLHHCKHCDVCDSDYCEGRHTFESAVTLDPTTEAEGERTYTCTECGYSYTETIDKLENTGGAVTDETEPEDNALSAEFVLGQGQTLKSAFFTQDELARIEAGETASVRLTVTNAGSTVPESDKTLIDGQADAQRVLMYLNIVIEKQIGTDDPVRVTQTMQPITIRVHLPQPEAGQKSLRCTAVCIHDGTLYLLEGEKNGEFFEFEASLFSSYGLIVSLAGDLNADSKVNNKDALLLFRRVSGIAVEVAVPERFLDLNTDSKINNKDALLLFRFVSGLDVTLK